MLHYVLDDNGEPLQVDDVLAWAAWFETAHAARVVAQDELAGGVSVSTVFLGLDHNWGFGGPPVLWETMIFGGPHADWQRRWCSREEAIAGHAEALQLASATRAIELE